MKYATSFISQETQDVINALDKFLHLQEKNLQLQQKFNDGSQKIFLNALGDPRCLECNEPSKETFCTPECSALYYQQDNDLANED